MILNEQNIDIIKNYINSGLNKLKLIFKNSDISCRLYQIDEEKNIDISTKKLI